MQNKQRRHARVGIDIKVTDREQIIFAPFSDFLLGQKVNSLNKLKNCLGIGTFLFGVY